MNVLIACEESQRVCTEFRRLGHRAFSCDIIDCSGGHPEWHIQQSVLPLINGRCTFKTTDGVQHTIMERWDMIIAFPPCTKTSNAGARHLWKGGTLNIQRYYDGLCGKALFLAIWAADCEKVVIENPTPSKVFEYPEPTQAIQPYQFGHPFTKKTLLWERGVAPLEPTNIVEAKKICVRQVRILISMEKNTEEFLPRIERKIVLKLLRALQKLWLSNGAGT